MKYTFVARCGSIDIATASAVTLAARSINLCVTFGRGEAWHLFASETPAADVAKAIRPYAAYMEVIESVQAEGEPLAVLSYPESGTAALSLAAYLGRAGIPGTVTFTADQALNKWCLLVSATALEDAGFINDYLRQWGEKWSVWSARHREC